MKKYKVHIDGIDYTVKNLAGIDVDLLKMIIAHVEKDCIEYTIDAITVDRHVIRTRTLLDIVCNVHYKGRPGLLIYKANRRTREMLNYKPNIIQCVIHSTASNM